MPKLINLELLANPYNWVIVFLFIVFALIGISFLFPQDTSSS